MSTLPTWWAGCRSNPTHWAGLYNQVLERKLLCCYCKVLVKMGIGFKKFSLLLNVFLVGVFYELKCRLMKLRAHCPPAGVCVWLPSPQ